MQHIYKIYTKQSAVAGWRARPGPELGGLAPGRSPPPGPDRRLFCIYLVYMLYIFTGFASAADLKTVIGFLDSWMNSGFGVIEFEIPWSSLLESLVSFWRTLN